MISTADRSERIYRIHQALQRGRPVNAARLAEDLGVSQRTAQEDLRLLRDRLRAPLEYDEVERTWRYTRPFTFLSTIGIDSDGITSLLLAGQCVELYDGTPFAAAARENLARIQGALADPDRVGAIGRWVADRVRFVSRPMPPIDPSVWGAVLEALERRVWLRVTYGLGRDAPRTFDLAPWALIVSDGEWYLVGRSDTHRDPADRTFHLSRVRAAEATDRRALAGPEVDLDRYVATGLAGLHTHDTEPAEVVLRFAPDAAPLALERPWHRDQEVEWHDDGAATVRFRATALFLVERWVLSWGSGVEVVGPRGLRERVGEELRRAAGAYEEIRLDHTNQERKRDGER